MSDKYVLSYVLWTLFFGTQIIVTKRHPSVILLYVTFSKFRENGV